MTVRRLKTYTAESGHTYEYYFVGKRAALGDDPFAPATEYIFDVASAGRPKYAVSVFLPVAAVRLWQAEHGRELVEPEQYAAAKMALLGAFDNTDDLIEVGRRVLVGAEELRDLLLQLGVD